MALMALRVGQACLRSPWLAPGRVHAVRWCWRRGRGAGCHMACMCKVCWIAAAFLLLGLLLFCLWVVFRRQLVFLVQRYPPSFNLK